MPAPSEQHPKVRAWRQHLLFFVVGLLVFETLSGLAIYLLPFSVPNQFLVVVHTVVGLAFIVPFAVYQLRHWRSHRRMPMTHVKLTGYFTMVVTVVAAVSGLVLTYQALFATRISYAMDLVHVVSTFALLAALLPHVLIVVWRDVKARHAEAMQPILAAERYFGVNMLLVVIVLVGVWGLLAYAYEPVALQNELPADYNHLYGEDRPFAPSLAETSTGAGLDPRVLGGSASCGRSGCHVEITKEWEVSAHRWAAMDPAFQKVQEIMAQQNGSESTRYCGGCHDPISLFSGTKNVFTEDLTSLTGYQEGISCLSCHAVEEADVKGIAKYVVGSVPRYAFELRDGRAAELLSGFLIRAYPWKHVESLKRPLYKTPEFCGTCHKQFIDEEINNVGWVQLQNQYDSWRKSRWNHEDDPAKTIECRECHMPLVSSLDPAAGDERDYNRTPDDEKHRSHRFLGANQFIPTALGLKAAHEQVRLTEEWLRGEIDIPEIADKWRDGPAVPVELIVPSHAEPGEEVQVQVHVTNNKVGHNFPTGPLDIIQAWVELTVTDQAGREVFATGRRDEEHFIEPGSFIFKAEAVDRYGNLIDRHNLWEMVGVRFKRTLYPGFSDNARYSFACPGTGPSTPADSLGGRYRLDAPASAATELHVSARLLYRKVDQFLLNVLFEDEDDLTAPVTVVSEDHAVIRVRPTTPRGDADSVAPVALQR